MNRTSYIILKLLSQHSLTSEELLKYIPINYMTLINNIELINDYLSDLSLPTIKKNNDEYILNLTNYEKNKFYEHCTTYSQNQRCNYLILKLLLEKKLNLEQEKEKLDISRSTIKRDFDKVKEYLLKYEIGVNSIKWQGIYLEINKYENINIICCEILMKFYYEYDMLPKLLKDYLNEIEVIPYYKIIKKIYDTYSLFNLRVGDLALKYFVALDICFNLLKDFKLPEVEKRLDIVSKNKEFEWILSKIKNESYFNLRYSNYLALGIWNVINKKFNNKESLEYIVKSFKNYFDIKLSVEEEYYLSLCLFYAKFKKDNNIYTVRKYKYSQVDKKLLSKINTFLKKNEFEMLYGDKLELLDLIKNIFRGAELDTNKKILIIKKEVNQGNSVNIKNILTRLYPKFNCSIESPIFLEIYKEELKKFDLILSDSIIDIDLEYKVYDYIFELTYLIDIYLIGVYLNNH